MGNVQFGIPVDLAVRLVRSRNIEAAIETGTYCGDSAAILRTLCPRVWSIEVSALQHKEALARHGDKVGLEFLLGDSAELLPALLDRVGEPVLFWLDGHAMPGNNVPGRTECPIMDEIAAINASQYGSDACVLIDDAVLFMANPPPSLRATDWPTILDVIDLLHRPFQRYVTVLDDVIIAGPSQIGSVVNQWWAELVEARGGTSTMVPLHRLQDAWNPTPREAFRRLGKSLVSRPHRRT